MRLLTAIILTSVVIVGIFLPQQAVSKPLIENTGDRESEYDFRCTDDAVPDMSGRYPGIEGKPVDLFSGAEAFTRLDLSIGSLYPIVITRRYDSRSEYDSPLGHGWAGNYDRRIYTYADGSVTLRKECGWKKRFLWSAPTGTYSAPIGESGTLVRNDDGGFTFTYKNGGKDFYDNRGRLSGRTDTNGNGVIVSYVSDERSPLTGLLLYNLDPSNPLYEVAYDYRVKSIEEKNAFGQPTGAKVEYDYDTATGRLTDIRDSASRSVTYNHDAFGNLNQVFGPNGTSVYQYEDSRFKSKITSIDQGQGVYLNTYDASGRVSRQEHGSGTIDFEYTMPGKETKVTTTIKNNGGSDLVRTRTVRFDTLGQVAVSTDTFGTTVKYTRDSGMNIVQEEFYEKGTVSEYQATPTGTRVTMCDKYLNCKTRYIEQNVYKQKPVLELKSTATYAYDTKNNMLSKTTAQGTALERTVSYTYDPVFNVVTSETVSSVVDPSQNRVKAYAYDQTKGNLLSLTESGLQGDGTTYTYETNYTYDVNGKVTSIDGPLPGDTDKISFNYDTDKGYLLSITQPLIGDTIFADHDPFGNPRTVTGPNGNITHYTYDTNGSVLTVQVGNENATQYAYSNSGCPTCGSEIKIDSITLPEGNTIGYTYNAMGQLSAIKDSQNNSINYTYDSEGNKLAEEIKDSSGTLQKTLSYQYDELNRLKTITNPDGGYAQYSYDVKGNKSSVRNPNGGTTNYTYDEMNRLTVAGQSGGTINTSYGYNANSNLTSVKDANNNTTTYRYNDKGRVYQVISPDTGTTTYQYEPAGNMTSKTDAKGVTIAYSYDALNRLTMIDFPNDTDITYTYDTCQNGKGRRCQMTDASGTTTYKYSAKGQVVEESKTILGVSGNPYVTGYAYDQDGNITAMTYPSGKVITYTYANDRAVSVLNGAATIAANISYKPFGGMSSIAYANGISGTFHYDNQYRLDTIIAGASGSIMNNTYGFDSNSNITTITPGKAYTYDPLDRLSSASGPWGSLAWNYDGVGNRLSENVSGYTYISGSNKLNTANGLSYGYDSNGNITGEGARTYGYNDNQRLVTVSTAGAVYTYNGNGQRVKKSANGTTTVFHYSLTGQIIAESNSSGTMAAEYVYLNGQPLAKIEGANTYYYHNDHLASPQKMTDSSGTVIWAADYKPFGETTSITGSITNNLRFPGQYYDAETGNHYNYFRDYNPVIGKYIEKDPIGIRRGKNHLYAYVGNNPIRRSDLRGLAAVIVNLGNSPITTSYSSNNGQQVVDVGPNSTSLTSTTDPDTLIFKDGSVVKIPDGSIVIITDSTMLDTFEPDDLNFVSPLAQLVDDTGIFPKLTGPKLIKDPVKEFGPFYPPCKK